MQIWKINCGISIRLRLGDNQRNDAQFQNLARMLHATIIICEGHYNFDLNSIMLEINPLPPSRAFSPKSSGKLINAENNCLPPTLPVHSLIQIGRTGKQLPSRFIVRRIRLENLHSINSNPDIKFMMKQHYYF